MVTVIINTAFERKTVRVEGENGKTYEASWTSMARESKKILPSIEAGLKKIGKSFPDIKRMVVHTGPGPFSSVRIGVTIANALGFALGVPVTAMGGKPSKIAVPKYATGPSITKSKRWRL